MEHHFYAFKLTEYYTNSVKPVEGDSVYVVTGYKIPNMKGVHYKLEGIFRISKKITGQFHRKSVPGKIDLFQFRIEFKAVIVPPKPIELENSDWYSKEEVDRYFSSGQNFNPLPKDLNYKERFDYLLAEFADSSDTELVQDLEDILNSDATEKDILSKARIGQGRFRKDVIETWGNGLKCAVTSFHIPELLIASHIKPWRSSNDTERLDPTNGILLATHLDKLFDNYLITFVKNKDKFYLEANPSVQSTLTAMGVKYKAELKASKLNPSETARMETYLMHHFSHYQKRLV